jgi:hypothetical protein
VRQINVTYRAALEQLKAYPFKLKTPINVEVIERRRIWISQSPDTGVEFDFTPCQSAEAAKKEAEKRFERRLSEWQIFGRPPMHGPTQKEPRVDKPRLLTSDEIQIRDGKIYFLEANDFTHVYDPQKPPVAGMDRDSAHDAACGQRPRLRHFVSLKGNQPPTCKECLKIYRAAQE